MHVLVFDVAHGQAVQLRLVPAAVGVDGEEDGPCDASAHRGDESEDPEIPQEEEGIQGGVVQHLGVFDLEEGLHPAEPGIGKGLTPLPFFVVESV